MFFLIFARGTIKKYKKKIYTVFTSPTNARTVQLDVDRDGGGGRGDGVGDGTRTVYIFDRTIRGGRPETVGEKMT